MSEDASKCEVFVCQSLVRSGSQMSDDASEYNVFIWLSLLFYPNGPVFRIRFLQSERKSLVICVVEDSVGRIYGGKMEKFGVK